jgi:hypothetical protein
MKQATQSLHARVTSYKYVTDTSVLQIKNHSVEVSYEETIKNSLNSPVQKLPRQQPIYFKRIKSPECKSTYGKGFKE